MRLKHFGDSFDLVKKSMLQWLETFGPWAAHPMFSEPFSERDATAFAKFLGVPLVSTEVLTPTTDRSAYFRSSAASGSLFLDPDTGVRITDLRLRDGCRYLYGSEVIHLATIRPHGLLMIFDQSLPRGGEERALLSKFQYFADKDVHAFAYMSHASFIVAGRSGALVSRARETVLAVSGLPNARVVTL